MVGCVGGVVLRDIEKTPITNEFVFISFSPDTHYECWIKKEAPWPSIFIYFVFFMFFYVLYSKCYSGYVIVCYVMVIMVMVVVVMEHIRMLCDCCGYCLYY